MSTEYFDPEAPESYPIGELIRKAKAALYEHIGEDAQFFLDRDATPLEELFFWTTLARSCGEERDTRLTTYLQAIAKGTAAIRASLAKEAE